MLMLQLKNSLSMTEKTAIHSKNNGPHHGLLKYTAVYVTFEGPN